MVTEFQIHDRQKDWALFFLNVLHIIWPGKSDEMTAQKEYDMIIYHYLVLHESFWFLQRNGLKNEPPALSALQIYDNFFPRSIKICRARLREIF